MSKVGGNRNYGYGKTLAWAGRNALRDGFGSGRYGTRASHESRWRPFAEFAKERRIVVPFDRIPKQLVQAFVAAEDSNFFHHTGIDMPGFKTLSEGDRVSFEIEESDRGPKAKNVVKL